MRTELSRATVTGPPTAVASGRRGPPRTSAPPGRSPADLLFMPADDEEITVDAEVAPVGEVTA